MSLPKHLGTPSAHDGAFGAAERLIAEVQRADRAIMSVTGSSGSNQAVALMLSRLAPDTTVLVARNAHHSTINALVAFGVAFAFLPTGYNAEFEALLPPTPDDVAEALRQCPADAVWITSPTYEGFAAHTDRIADVVHADNPDRLLIVDEAWGSHLAFHEGLPQPALASGADLVVQSTHKQGGSLQQTGVILWKESRIDSDLMVDAHGQWTTTSPSFPLLASIDAAHRELATRGRELLERSIERTECLNALAAERLPDLQRFATSDRLKALADRVAGHDPTKTSFALTAFDVTGHDLADRLITDRYRVTVEKSGLNTIMFLTPFQLPEGAEKRAVSALAALLTGREQRRVRELPPDPFAALATSPEVSPSVTARSAMRNGERVPSTDAVGQICAETVEAYPPGIPVLLPGFRVTASAIDYLQAVRACGGTIHGADPTADTTRVIISA
jgi:arginine decarboxylase